MCFKLFRLGPGDIVAALILFMPVVSPDPDAEDLVRCRYLDILSPEIGVLDLFKVPLDPAFEPLVDPFDHIRGVRDDLDVAGLFKGFQPLDDTAQLHAVVGGVRFTAADDTLAVVVAQYRTISAGAWIAKRTAVTEKSYLLQSYPLSTALP